MTEELNKQHAAQCGLDEPTCSASDEQWDEGDWMDDYGVCAECGGDGYVDYDDHPELWGEDSPSEPNHKIICPCCGGSGDV